MTKMHLLFVFGIKNCLTVIYYCKLPHHTCVNRWSHGGTTTNFDPVKTALTNILNSWHISDSLPGSWPPVFIQFPHLLATPLEKQTRIQWASRMNVFLFSLIFVLAESNKKKERKSYVGFMKCALTAKSVLTHLHMLMNCIWSQIWIRVPGNLQLA